MKNWIGSAVPAVMMVAAACVVSAPAMAASADVRDKPPAQTTDVSRNQRPQYRPDANRPGPSYYGRPAYYAPTPYTPLPPASGYRWEWW
jgi:hypothetical protein